LGFDGTFYLFGGLVVPIALLGLWLPNVEALRGTADQIEVLVTQASVNSYSKTSIDLQGTVGEKSVHLETKNLAH